eukprot:5528049-Pleurochrysis_carterae.AAC.3
MLGTCQKGATTCPASLMQVFAGLWSLSGPERAEDDAPEHECVAVARCVADHACLRAQARLQQRCASMQQGARASMQQGARASMQ